MKANLPVDGRKLCVACNQMVPVEDFYRDKTKSGLHTYCKPCLREKKRKVYYADHEKTMEAERRKRADPKTRERNNRHQRNTYRRYPEKFAARRKLNRAIQIGEIQRQPCKECGTPKAQGHHHDYSKPFDVEWLCAKCHAKEHRVSPEGLADIAASRPERPVAQIASPTFTPIRPGLELDARGWRRRKDRAACPVCGKWVLLSVGGKFRSHVRRGFIDNCPGSAERAA